MKKIAITVLSLASLALCSLGLQKKEYARLSSPDGEFVAVAEYREFRSMLPSFPGQSGDHPGWITVFGRDGRSMGRSPTEMVSAIHDVRWRKHGVFIPSVGSWGVIE